MQFKGDSSMKGFLSTVSGTSIVLVALAGVFSSATAVGQVPAEGHQLHCAAYQFIRNDDGFGELGRHFNHWWAEVAHHKGLEFAEVSAVVLVGVEVGGSRALSSNFGVFATLQTSYPYPGIFSDTQEGFRGRFMFGFNWWISLEFL